MRDSCVFYKSFYEAISSLPISEQAIVYDAIFNYIFYEKLPKIEGSAKLVFTLVKPQIDSNNKKFKDGKKGGRPKDKNIKSINNDKPFE